MLAVALGNRGELGAGVGSGGGAESPVRSDNLGGMLLDAEKQKASLQVGMACCLVATHPLRRSRVIRRNCI